jgi:two-component system sensor histidine kinase ChvG
MGNVTRLNQVFQNIISNALSFSHSGTVITIKLERPSKRAIISIEDQGPGIPENKLDHIFDRFYSERPKHEAYGSHSGLGLSICKQIIAAHNGMIYAENILSKGRKIKGARFVIILNTL